MVADKRTVRRPRPEEFSDFRAYLREMVAYLKKTQRGFSFRNFARKAGYTSPGFLSAVIEGKRNLAPSSIEKFAQGLGLTEKETENFEALVMLNQATSDTERNRHYARLRRNGHSISEQAILTDAQYEIYSLWYALPIRELLAHEDFREDPEWIAKTLQPRIRPSEARRALVALEKAGLIARDEEGRLQACDRSMATPANVQSLAVRNFHRSMLEKAAGTLDGLPLYKRNITSLMLSVTPEQYEELCKRISEFQDELIRQYEGDAPASEAAEVFLVGFQFFPLTKKKGKEEG